MLPGSGTSEGGHMGKYFLIGVIFYDLGLVVVACSLACIFVFSPEGVFVPVVGPHPGVNPPKKK